MMGSLASSAAGSMAGSAMGHYMFGGASSSSQPAAPAGQAAAGEQAVGGGQALCGMETKSFLQCMSETNNDFSRCDHIYDMFKQCHGTARPPAAALLISQL
jgi:hypothetical protein